MRAGDRRFLLILVLRVQCRITRPPAPGPLGCFSQQFPPATSGPLQTSPLSPFQDGSPGRPFPLEGSQVFFTVTPLNRVICRSSRRVVVHGSSAPVLRHQAPANPTGPPFRRPAVFRQLPELLSRHEVAGGRLAAWLAAAAIMRIPAKIRLTATEKARRIRMLLEMPPHDQSPRCARDQAGRDGSSG